MSKLNVKRCFVIDRRCQAPPSQSHHTVPPSHPQKKKKKSAKRRQIFTSASAHEKFMIRDPLVSLIIRSRAQRQMSSSQPPPNPLSLYGGLSPLPWHPASKRLIRARASTSAALICGAQRPRGGAWGGQGRRGELPWPGPALLLLSSHGRPPRPRAVLGGGLRLLSGLHTAGCLR